MQTYSFDDINDAMSLSLLARNQNKRIEIPLERRELSDNEKEELDNDIKFPYIALEVVVAEWKKQLAVINFKDTKAKLSLIAVSGKSVYKWDNVIIVRHKMNAGYFVNLLIGKNQLGQKYNRRQGIRLRMACKMDVQQGNYESQVYVKDVSFGGVGFLETPDALLDESQPIILTLIDPKSYQEVGKLVLHVARRVEQEDGRILTGCTVDKPYLNIMQKFVAVKQMEQLGAFSNTGVKSNETHKDWKRSVAYELHRTMRKDDE